jgi:hypothetical protein
MQTINELPYSALSLKLLKMLNIAYLKNENRLSYVIDYFFTFDEIYQIRPTLQATEINLNTNKQGKICTL